jgi:molybdenum cofactor cytidylyltransferase
VIVAVIPAAGKSLRMGRPKLSLPFRDSTVLEHVVSAFRGAKVDPVVVAVGPHVPELLPLARRAGAEVCALPAETPDMRATVEAALTWIESRWPMTGDDAWLLAPADHPCLEPEIIARLLDERNRHPESSLFIPTHEGKRGHPALIAWGHVAGIRSLPQGMGLNQFFRSQSGQTWEVAVASPGVLVDLDTPEDYRRSQETSQ